MRRLFVVVVALVGACSFRLPDPVAVDVDAPPQSPAVDAPAVTPVDAAPPIDMPPPPPPPPPPGQHCHSNFPLGGVNVSIDCDRDNGTATCQCFRDGVQFDTCTTFSLAPCSAPTCCEF